MPYQWWQIEPEAEIVDNKWPIASKKHCNPTDSSLPEVRVAIVMEAERQLEETARVGKPPEAIPTQ